MVLARRAEMFWYLGGLVERGRKGEGDGKGGFWARRAWMRELV